MSPEQDSSELMPAAFLGHGNPMNALEHNRYTEAWRAFGGPCRGRGPILVVSAHWYINATAVTAMAAAAHHPRLLRLPATSCSPSSTRRRGCPSSPTRSRDAVAPDLGGRSTSTAGASTTAPGRCSCTPSPTPTSRSCSCRSTRDKPFDYHLELGARLAPLRERGVLIVGSGNVVHNLRRHRLAPRRRRLRLGAALRRGRAGADARRPDRGRPRSTAHRDFAAAVPTPDHFIPLLYLAGLAGARPGEPRRRAGRRLRLRLAVDDRLHARDGLPRGLRRGRGPGEAGADRPAGREQLGPPAAHAA